ncbi:MAG: hypothetical protein Q9181_008050 [Wetmoreana brouardii]
MSRPALDINNYKSGSFELPLHRRYTASGNITEDNYDYLTSVSIGGQNVNLLLDTASSLLWVISPDTANLTRPNMHKMYDPKKSKPPAPVQKGLNYSASYGGGFGGFGYLVKESVSIGNAVAHDMIVGVATEVGPNYPQGMSDGIMGLGFQRNYYNMTYRDRTIPDPQPTFVEILIAQGGLDLPVFTTNFNPTAKGAIPSIEFGKIDRSKYRGELSNVPVNKNYGNWTVDNIIFEVNGTAALYNQSMIFGLIPL